jgi:hypothetical protein
MDVEPKVTYCMLIRGTRNKPAPTLSLDRGEGEPACRSLGEGRGEGGVGFIPHLRKGGQGGI